MRCIYYGASVKLAKIKIENFKCFKNLDFDFARMSIFVGENNCGKSALFSAIDKFFASTGKGTSITHEDFHISENGEKAEQLSIQLFFTALSENAITEFGEYTATPEVTFKLSCQRNRSNIISKFTGIRHGLNDFANAFALGKSAPAAEFNAEYDRLTEKYVDLPSPKDVKNKNLKLGALRTYELDNLDECIAIESGDEAYGVIGPVPRIEKFLKWVLIPAVKDASDESSEGRNSFSELINFATRRKTNFDEKIKHIEESVSDQLSTLKTEQQGALKEINNQLNRDFQKISIGSEAIELNWDQSTNDLKLTPPQAQANIISGNHKGPVGLFGHGLQRNYLVALLKVINEIEVDGVDHPKLLLGFEEPELYQHPPQARILAQYLRTISITDQILITTHSPLFVDPDFMGTVHRMKSEKGVTSIISVTLEGFTKRMANLLSMPNDNTNSTIASLVSLMDLNIREIFFSRFVVIVEGIEDIGYLHAARDIFQEQNKWIECGINIIPALGKFQIIPIVELCKAYRIPFYVIFDSDSSHEGQTKDGKEKSTKEKNELLKLQLNIEKEGAFFKEIYQGNECTIWPENIQSSVVAENADFLQYLNKAKNIYQSKAKNPKVVYSALSSFHAAGNNSVCLKNLVNSIIALAKTNGENVAPS